DLTSAHGGDVNGGISDIPVVGDWDDDGLDEIGILRAGGSNFTVWRWLLSGTADGYEDDPVSGFTKTDFIHGNTATDIPVIGDWNNSGVQTVGLVRDNGSNLQWILSNSVAAASDITFEHGNSGDLAVVGDWDGDGYDTAGLVREHSSGDMRWLLTNNDNSRGTDALDRRFGNFANDLTVTGDWNGVLPRRCDASILRRCPHPRARLGGTRRGRRPDCRVSKVARVSRRPGHERDARHKPLGWKPPPLGDCIECHNRLRSSCHASPEAETKP
ncbi:MAG: hypothetical protein ACOC3G_05545, partial [Phycisphaeraceae bacterium]